MIFAVLTFLDTDMLQVKFLNFAMDAVDMSFHHKQYYVSWSPVNEWSYSISSHASDLVPLKNVGISTTWIKWFLGT